MGSSMPYGRKLQRNLLSDLVIFKPVGGFVGISFSFRSKSWDGAQRFSLLDELRKGQVTDIPTTLSNMLCVTFKCIMFNLLQSSV